MPILAVLFLAFAGSVQDKDEGHAFVFKEGNFKLVYPRTWARIKNPAAVFQLSLINAGNFIGISGVETDVTVESLLKSIEDGQKQQSEDYKPMSRAPLKIAGANALQLRSALKREGIPMTMIATAFTHQGCAYRIIGVQGVGTFASFEQDYHSILASFDFLGDRKDWLERFEGKPVRTAFLAGLSAFELNRPRWTESTFRIKQDWSTLEHVYFDFQGQAAWIMVRARLSAGTPSGELDRFRDDLSGRLKKSAVRPVSSKGRNGEVPGFEISGEFSGEPYFIRGAVVMEEGITVELFLEGYERQQEVTRRDWEQLMASFTLRPRSKPEKPMAYPVRSWDESQTPDPALSAILVRARRLVPGGGDVAAVSPDGSRILLVEPEGGNVFVDAATGNRQKAAFTSAVPAGARWSRDGKRLVWPGEEGVCIATLDPPELRTLGVRGSGAAFGSTEDEILVCTAETDNLQYPVSRLERIGAKGDRKTLIDFPLSRVSWPELSPDGRRLAVVTNRDYLRSAPAGGHLYTGAADGSDLRPLTRGPEHISHVCWSSDGRFLYAVRRLSRGSDGAVGPGGPSDLWRISVESAEAKNLTRSDHIGGVWVAGGDLLIWVKGYSLPESQRGLFQISPEELEKASSTLPERAILDVRAHGLAVAERVRGALGAGALRDLVPTPERMASAAKAFAVAVTEICGIPLDFSRKSLDDLRDLVWSLDVRHGDLGLLVGFGAYYGETLRATAGAVWMLQPVPFGDAGPGGAIEGTPLADPILPFSDIVATMVGAEEGGLRTTSFLLGQDQGRKIILVHPPSYLEQAVRVTTGPDYYEARKKLDAGEVRPAIDLLVKELERRPKNRALALEVIGLCEAARLPDVAKTLTRTAVEAGNEVRELLLRYAEDTAASDAPKAREALRRAAHGDYPPAAVFLRLGKSYAAGGDRPLAEACWRRAYANATPTEQGEIHSLMGMMKTVDADE